MKKRYLLTRIICFILVCCMVVGSPISTRADDDGEDETDLNLEEIRAFDRHGKELLNNEFSSTDLGEISYIRKHTKATSKINYATKYLIMSAKELSFSTDITMDIQAESASKSSPYVIVPLTGKDNVTDYDEVITSYFFDNQELNTVAKKLGIRPAEGATTIDIYISHVFEISPAEESAWTSLRSRIGKISNSANSKAGNKNSSHYLTANKYDNGNDSLLWYRTMDEFVKPGGMSTFWSNGAANEKMYDCMNIKLQIAVNPKVYGIPVTVFYYDESTGTAVKTESYDDADLKYGEWWKYNGTYSVDEDGKYYIKEGGNTYYIQDGMSAYRTKKNYSWTGNLATDADKTTKIKSSGIDVDFTNQYYSVKNGNSKTKTIAMYIPVTKEDPTPKPTPSVTPTPEVTPTPTPSRTPDPEDIPVKISVVYYDVKDKTPVNTVAASNGTVGQKSYSVKIDASECGEGYSVDTTGTVLAAHGSKKAIKTKYATAEAAEQYSVKSFTSSKVVIKSALVDAKYTAIWIPVKSGTPVAVKYVDEGGNTIVTDDGGVAEKDKKYTYTVDPDAVGSTYEVHPENSYLENGTDTKPLTPSGNDVSIEKFPYDTPTDLIVPCTTKSGPSGSGNYFTWNYMDTKANGGNSKIISDDFDVTTAIPATENEYGQVTASKYLTMGGISKHTGSRSYTVTVKQRAYVYWYEYDMIPVYETDPDSGETVTDGYGNPVQATDTYGNPLYAKGPDYEVSDSTTVSTSITVTLPWEWYSLDNYALYKLISASLNNGTADAPFDITPSFSDTVSASASVSTAEADHVKDPAGWTGTGMTITLSGSISNSSSGYSKPSWPSIDVTSATNTVKSTLGEMQVKNDSFKLNGKTVLNNAWKTYSNRVLPDTGNVKQSGTVTAKSTEQTIPKNKQNKTYTSTGNVKYQLVGQHALAADSTYTAAVTVNPVNVHTPIVCDVNISSDNLKYVQASSYDSSIMQLVVGRSDSLGVGASASNNPNMTNDFTVEFSNNGTHRAITGYGTRDYKKYLLQEGGKSGNMVQFAFDVIADVGNDYNESNDILISAYDWYQLSTGTVKQRFYLPEWVEEGTYDIDFKSVALNGNNASPANASYANLQVSQYAAADSDTAQVSGKMYGFTVYDIDSSSEWSDVFRLGTTLKSNYPSKYSSGRTSNSFDKNKSYTYTSGNMNELGLSTGEKIKYAFPMVAGSNPKYTNLGVLKAGYTWRFKLSTVSSLMANEAASIKITPTFYWVDKDGKNRTKVNLYYSETINGVKKSLVKIGGTVDSNNVKKNYAAESGFGINPEELKKTATIKGVNYDTWTGAVAETYRYSGITAKSQFKTFANSEYATFMSSKGLNGSKSANDMTKLKQNWYFEYSLPEFHACASNFDLEQYVRDKGSVTYKESFWKNDGYIIVNFDVTAYDRNGNKLMSYSNEANAANGACDMFLTEFNGTNTGYKTITDANGVSFSLYAGDVFIVYADPNKMKSGDYSSDHLN